MDPPRRRERDGFRMVGLRLAALWLGLIAPASVPEARGAEGEGGQPGWLAIAPPIDAFDWVDASTIRVGPDGRGEVVAARALVRSGAAEARMPGPPRPPLAKGTAIRLLDRPALTIGEGARAR